MQLLPTLTRRRITIFLAAALVLLGVAAGALNPPYAAPFWLAAAIVALSLKMANTWQKFVVLRAGKLQGVKGPGLFVIFPVIDNVVAVIDERIQTTAFNAEAALTRRPHGRGDLRINGAAGRQRNQARDTEHAERELARRPKHPS